MKNVFSNMSRRERALRVLQVFKDVGIDYSFGPGGIQFDGFYSSQHNVSVIVKDSQIDCDNTYRSFKHAPPQEAFNASELPLILPLDAA